MLKKNSGVWNLLSLKQKRSCHRIEENHTTEKTVCAVVYRISPVVIISSAGKKKQLEKCKSIFYARVYLLAVQHIYSVPRFFYTNFNIRPLSPLLLPQRNYTRLCSQYYCIH
jgi:hypothetical protein